MFFQADLVTQMAVGAVTGLSHAFGQRLIPWLIKSWDWYAKSNPGMPSHLIQQVGLDSLRKTGIPSGHRLFAKHGTTFKELAQSQLSQWASEEDSLWLIPEGEIWQPTHFASDDMVGHADIGIEFDPESAMLPIDSDGGTLDRHWLAALLQGTVAGIFTSLPPEIRKGVVSADDVALNAWSKQIDHSLRGRGLRCCGVRNVSATATADGASGNAVDQPSADERLAELAAELAQIKTEGDWNRLVDSLKRAGVPLDSQTTQRLAVLQDSIRERHISPAAGVQRLAELTADAFERAGIVKQDLESWQTLSERLGDVDAELESTPHTAPQESPVSVAVAALKRPTTWFVWTREEVDRRQLLYTRRTVLNCRLACEQALMHVRDLQPLRQVRELKEQLSLTEEMLATVPPLNPARSSLRVDKQVAKRLISAYADAVKTADLLARSTDQMLSSPPSSDAWQRHFLACREASTKLNQYVRDRRNIR